MNDFTRHILTEVYGYYTNTILNEATMAQDVYTKFYEDQLPLEDFMKVVMLDPTSKKTNNGYTKGAFLPWLMENYDKFYIKNYYQLMKETMQIFVTIRNSAKDLIPQDFVGDINEYDSYRSLVNEMQDLSAQYEFNKANKRGTQTIKGFPEFKIIPDLCNVEFTGEYWTVLSPTCREGGIYYGHGTEWCTAMTGNNLERDYYNEYLDTYGGKYYILFNAHTKRRYQLHFENGDNGMFCDEYDDPISTWDEMCAFKDEATEIMDFFSSVREDIDPEFISRPDMNDEDFSDWLESEWDGNMETFKRSIWGRRDDSPVTEYTYGNYVIFSYKGRYVNSNFLSNVNNLALGKLDSCTELNNTVSVKNRNGEFIIINEDYSYIVYNEDLECIDHGYSIHDMDVSKGVITFKTENGNVTIPINTLNNSMVFDMFITRNNRDDFLTIPDTINESDSLTILCDIQNMSIIQFNPNDMHNLILQHIMQDEGVNQEMAVKVLNDDIIDDENYEYLINIIRQHGQSTPIRNLINNQ